MIQLSVCYNYIVAINMKKGKIIGKVKVEQPVEGDINLVTFAEQDPGSKNLSYLFKHQLNGTYYTENYIYNYNDSLEQLSSIKVKYNQRSIHIRYNKYENGYYHLIGDEIELKNDDQTKDG